MFKVVIDVRDAYNDLNNVIVYNGKTYSHLELESIYPDELRHTVSSVLKDTKKLLDILRQTGSYPKTYEIRL